MARHRAPKANAAASTARKALSTAEAVQVAQGVATGLRRMGGLAQADSLLIILRNSREFATMAELGASLLEEGVALSPRARRFVAQSFIELGRFEEAMELLDGIIEDQGDADEVLEAHGLRGRIHKQIYLNEAVRGRRAVDRLRWAVDAYLTAYDESPTHPAWHGMNAAALLARAVRDGVKGLPVERRLSIAEDIGTRLTTRRVEALDFWDMANIAESALVLKDYDAAELWCHRAAWLPDAAPFAQAGWLRQLREVWQLDPASSPGSRILPALDARLHEVGRTVLISPDKAAEAGPTTQLEKVFGANPYMPFEAWTLATECAKSVCRVENKLNQGFGTGFVVNGRLLNAKLPNEPVMVTNAHVLTRNGDGGSLTPAQAHVVFYASKDKGGKPHSSTIKKILWSSPPGKFDTTIAQLTRPLKAQTPLTLASSLPSAEEKQKVYVIGHPGGGALVFSLNDNDLLDHGDPSDPRVHYRTPTEPGSSGSPVFNAQWELIALHHAGNSALPRIHGSGTYAANEGISFKHIGAAIRLR